MSNFEIWQFFVNNKAGYQSFKITLYCNYTRVHICDCFDDLSILESNYFAHYRKKKKIWSCKNHVWRKKKKKICARYMFDMKRRIVSSNVVEQWIRSRLRCIAKISRQNSEKFWHYDTRNRSTIFQIITTERIDNRCSKIRIDNHYIYFQKEEQLNFIGN